MAETQRGLDALPAELRTRAGETASWLRREQPELLERIETEGLAGGLVRVLAASEFACGVITRWPELVVALLDAGRLGARPAQESRLESAADADEATFAREIRLVRQREMLGIAWRDLAGLATTDDTLEQVSALAESLVGQASEFALDKLAQRVDHTPPPPVILAMGKLGGRELNFSSDIDVVFLFSDDFEDAASFYLRHARHVIALLDQRSEHGFVFRVDTRLRPFGQTGALALSLGAFEDYLQSHGREWERYAYVKSRAITGKKTHIARLEKALAGFVYRRYIDYGLFESLRDTKKLIQEDVARRSLEHDIKRGDGGIREIEFIVQALQLIRGGRQPQLQTPALRDAMTILAQLGHLAQLTVQELGAAYGFLRRLENRLQMWRDGQTHCLPTGPEGRLRLAFSMDCQDWAELAGQIERHRDAVRGHFAELLGPLEDEDEDVAEPTPGFLLWHERLDEAQALEALMAAGVAQPEGVLAALARLRRSPSLARIDRRGQRRLDRLMPVVLDQAAFTGDGAVVLARVVEIIEGVGRRSAYFSLLNENPHALERLVDICGRSANIARDVAANPLLLDSLIDPSVVQLPTSSQRAAQLRMSLADVSDDDLEVLIETLAHFKHTAAFEVAVADLSSSLTVMKVSDHLTSTAETVVREILRVARAWLERRHGEPVIPKGKDEAGFCIIAYGKLGGLELGYGSDLDLVFVYDCGSADPPTSGPRVVSSSVYFARLVQRIAHIAGAPTRFGALYQVDMRLRPSGNSGPLVTSIEAFERYQNDSAWTWEHQALLRARPIAGDEELAQRFSSVRRELLLAKRDPNKLAEDIFVMRERLRKSHYRAKAGRFDIKHGPGGLLDTEFLVQYWLLLHACDHPSLIEYSDHMRQLDALGASAAVAGNTCRLVQAAYLDYRTALHRQALLGERRAVSEERFSAQRIHIDSLWRETFRALL